MSRAEAVRERVSDTYARRVTSGTGCCGGTTCEEPVQLGYGRQELAEVPAETAGTSFGCGNPLAFAEVRPGETVVDLGCGAGLDLMLAARRVGPTGRVIGVDMTDAMLDRARAAAAKAGATQVEVRKGLIEALPVESGSVDWVISNCVINLSPEKERVFAEIARVLKPGGRFSISDIVVEGLPWWARRIAGLYDACVGGAISEMTYVAGLRVAGLSDVTVTERQVYGEAELSGYVLSGAAGRLPRSVVRAGARRLAGRIWSARFSGRRPAQTRSASAA